jgi:predicted transcriptional regulator
MRLSESEIRALMLVAGSEKALRPGDLSKALNLRPESLSRVVTDLVNKGLLEREGKEIALARTPAAESFKRLYFSHRASPLHILLADRKADLLSRIDAEQKSVETLEKETGIPKKTIYRYLRDFIRLGAVKRSKQGRTYLYSFNCIIWPELKDFVTALLEYGSVLLVPREALLIKSDGDSVLFKSIRQQDATPTSFSAYGEYGIDLGLRDNYYTLPKRELTIEEIFIHSLDSAEDLRQRLFCILFYLKNRDKLESVDHPVMKHVKAVLQGESIKGYPSLEDIEDRAELYEIEL